MDLTPRQRDVYDFIRQHHAEVGHTPTLSEIAEHFFFKSVNAAARHVNQLIERGWIERTEGAHRGLRIPAGQHLDRPTLPLIGRIAAGSPITASVNVESRIAVDPGLFRPTADLLHRVIGDSMLDVGVQPDDLVGIHLQPSAPNGSIVAACVLDERTGDELVTLKRYARNRDIVILTSENTKKNYPPIVINLARADDSQLAQRFRVAGVMAGLIRTGAPR